MHELNDLKMMLMDEIRDITKKGELTAGNLDTVDKLLNSMKNACKVIMYDEYADDGYSYASADTDMMNYSNARGRTGNIRRDTRGRYSRRDNRYSYDDGKSDKIELLRDMMNEVSSDDERRALQKIIRRMEQG